MEKVHYVRLPVKNAFNIRDLGGYACKSNDRLCGVTKWNSFLRGDDLSKLDGEDIEFLKNYGVKTVIDLRSENEVKSKPDPFANVNMVDYHNISLMAGTVDDVTKVLAEDPCGFISAFYIRLIKNETGLIKNILEIIADAKDGGILFHCTVGKDRTGVVAAILLAIAGVEEADIVSNYEVTYTYNQSDPNIDVSLLKLPKEIMCSNPDYLKNAFNYIKSNFKSVENYLISSGIEIATLEKIRKRFIE